jgi:predicted nucleic acid-binding protein
MLACESVLSEACFLVRKLPGGIEAVLGLVDRGVVEVPFRLADEFAHVRRLMVRFRNVPMSLADACLVRMAEQHPDRSILTCDRDFAIYRLRGGRVPRLVAPFG